MSNFYNEEELKNLGLKRYGKNVLISKKCSIYGAENVSIGDNVRVDDFCLLSGNIKIGNYVHISAYSVLYGSAGIEIGNFCGISPRGTIYSASDDFSGEYMVSPMVPCELTNLHREKVAMKDFVQLGANTIVMPGVQLGEGSVTGAFSFVCKSTEEWTINFGIPCKKQKDRKKNIIELSKQIQCALDV